MRKLVYWVAALAALLVVAVPALAQGQQFTATGELERAEPRGEDPEPVFVITDEESEASYELISGFVDLEPYVGERVTVEGVPVPGPGDPDRPRLLNVTSVAPADDPDASVTATFELTVEGEPPPGTEFFGTVGEAPLASGALLDQDGDGVYTASLPVPRDTEQAVEIQQAEPINDEPDAPLQARTLRDFGTVEFDEDQTFRAEVSFEDADGGSTTTPDEGGSSKGGETPEEAGVDINEDGAVDADDGAYAAATSDAAVQAAQSSGKGSTLPATGGIPAGLLGTGLLLPIMGLLLARRSF